MAFIVLQGVGQNGDRYIGLGFGPIAYRGDLNHSFSKFQSALSFNYFKDRDRRVQSVFNLTIGKVSGSNEDYIFQNDMEMETSPNTYFQTSFQSLTYRLKIRFLKQKKVVPYISPGIGLFRFVPKNENSTSLSDQDNSRAPDESYSPITISLPLSLGVNTSLNEFKFGLSLTWLNPLTDYIDNIKQWGNKEGNDNLLLYSISVAIPLKFSKKSD